MYRLQMAKPNKNDCENGKQANLLVQGARSDVQKLQMTVDTKLLANKKVCIIHTS